MSPATDPTRERILEAARREFAAHGIFGARIDRIAKTALTSKERLYAHFRSKEQLYAQVALAEITRLRETVGFDAYDLPASAGRLFDYFAEHEDAFRLLSWGRLEQSPADALAPERVAALQEAIDQIREAQSCGAIDPAWDPFDVKALVGQIAICHLAIPELKAAAALAVCELALDKRRAAVVMAVSRLFPAAPARRPAA
jgi:AcrR family transcriptional regulator